MVHWDSYLPRLLPLGESSRRRFRLGCRALPRAGRRRIAHIAHHREFGIAALVSGIENKLFQYISTAQTVYAHVDFAISA